VARRLPPLAIEAADALGQWRSEPVAKIGPLCAEAAVDLPQLALVHIADIHTRDVRGVLCLAAVLSDHWCGRVLADRCC
ncbi:hypothetical protein, partial [Clostridium perfringens]